MRVIDTTAASSGELRLPSAGSPLAALAAHINELTQTPGLADVKQWFSELLIRRHDYDCHRVFTPRKYARNLIARSEFAELLLLCWRPGHRTPIHDHGGSIGVVMVCEGLLTETMYERAQTGRVKPHNIIAGPRAP
jgi:cysteine dioxygenase